MSRTQKDWCTDRFFADGRRRASSQIFQQCLPLLVAIDAAAYAFTLHCTAVNSFDHTRSNFLLANANSLRNGHIILPELCPLYINNVHICAAARNNGFFRSSLLHCFSGGHCHADALCCDSNSVSTTTLYRCELNVVLWNCVGTPCRFSLDIDGDAQRRRWRRRLRSAMRRRGRDLYFLRGVINQESASAHSAQRPGKQRLGDSVPHALRVRTDTDIQSPPRTNANLTHTSTTENTSPVGVLLAHNVFYTKNYYDKNYVTCGHRHLRPLVSTVPETKPTISELFSVKNLNKIKIAAIYRFYVYDTQL